MIAFDHRGWWPVQGLHDGKILANMAAVRAAVQDGPPPHTSRDGFPFDYLTHLRITRTHVDNVVVLSGSNESKQGGQFNEGIAGFLAKYRRELNANLLYVCVCVLPHWPRSCTRPATQLTRFNTPAQVR